DPFAALNLPTTGKAVFLPPVSSLQMDPSPFLPISMFGLLLTLLPLLQLADSIPAPKAWPNPEPYYSDAYPGFLIDANKPNYRYFYEGGQNASSEPLEADASTDYRISPAPVWPLDYGKRTPPL